MHGETVKLVHLCCLPMIQVYSLLAQTRPNLIQILIQLLKL